MGAFRWSRIPKTSKFSISFEWAMQNLSRRIQPSSQEQEDQERNKRGKRNIEKDQELFKGKEEEEEKARCEWDFKLSTVVSSSATVAGSDALGAVEFDPTHSMVATGGIARKIRVYSLTSLLPHGDGSTQGEHNTAFLDHVNACQNCVITPAKLSSLRWKPGSGGRVLSSGDYDGVVMEHDLERKTPIFERDEHGGRVVWSVDYSHWDPVVGASGSDDGTMQIWDPRIDDGGRCVAMVQPSVARSSVCCVEFDPSSGPLVAVGCADRRAYGYDIRKMVDPVMVLDGHGKTVSYVRFLDCHTIVTAGTDGCLKLWNLMDSSLVRTYKGHVNSRNFVGLSAWRHGGLLGCGSENNQLFVYDRRWGQPIWVHGLNPLARGGSDTGFVSSVCWRQVGDEQCTLVAGGSDGVLQVISGKRKPSYSVTPK